MDMLRDLQAELVARLDLRRTDVNRMDDDALRRLAGQCIRDIMSDRGIAPGPDRERLERQLLQDAVGRGVLEDLLDDDDVTEIMVNGPAQIFG